MNKQNVGTNERWASGVGGAALALWGLRRASLPGPAGRRRRRCARWRGVSGWCNLYGALGIDRAGAGQTVGNLGVKIDRGVTVAAPPERLYHFWRNFDNLPRIMSHVERVEVLSETRSRWHVKTPAGMTVAWEAEIINDQPPHLLAWRTVDNAMITHAGSVRFTPAGSGTRIDVSLQYDPPGGALTHAMARLVDADAGRILEHDLNEFKQALESGRLAA
jgi:uncharacterized membrane protein